MEHNVTANSLPYFANFEQEANWESFKELFYTCFANMPVTDIYDCANVAAHARIVLEYLHKNPQFIKNPGKLPKDVVDLALKDT